MKRVSILLILLFLLHCFGCFGRNKVKYSSDSLLAMQAMGLVKEIKWAYERKEKNILERNLSPTLSRQILGELDFDHASLSFNFQMVNIQAERVTLRLTWQSSFSIRHKEYDDEGFCVFSFTGTPMKLVGIKGNNPFQIPIH